MEERNAKDRSGMVNISRFACGSYAPFIKFVTGIMFFEQLVFAFVVEQCNAKEIGIHMHKRGVFFKIFQQARFMTPSQ